MKLCEEEKTCNQEDFDVASDIKERIKKTKDERRQRRQSLLRSNRRLN